MFKVGNWVYLNPRFLKYPDLTRGIITAETVNQERDIYIIDWEDGKRGQTSLDSRYLLLV